MLKVTKPQEHSLVQTRRVVARRNDVVNETESLFDLAREKVRKDGGSLRLALRELREERRERARDLALADAPAATKANGKYTRVSNDPRWPFGVEDGQIIAPFGLSQCGLPRTLDPDAGVRRGPRKGQLEAKREARDIIMSKLELMGCDPIKIMAEIAMDAEAVKPEVRLRAAAELASMIYPRLRGADLVQREEKTVFVVQVPDQQPANAQDWLAKSHGVRAIQNAVAQESAVIEGDVVVKD